MRIYPDPELPDVKIEWGDQDCRTGTGNVEVKLTGLDSDAGATSTVPCSDLELTFVNVARERYHVDGSLLDLAGNVFTTSDGGDVDLRNGFNQRAGLYFDGFSNFRFAWTFGGGATCASLGANIVTIVFSLPGDPEIDAFPYACEFSPGGSGTVAPGTYTAQLRASAGDEVVAVSAETAPFTITQNGLTNLGSIVISP